MLSSWHYFEAGHGKGPCDGVGAVAKRRADDAVRQGKVTIQYSDEFYAWASKTQGTVEYIYVKTNVCEATQKELSAIKIQPIKGTLQIHAVFGLGQNQIATRNATCFCTKCYVPGVFKGHHEYLGCRGLRRERRCGELRKRDNG